MNQQVPGQEPAHTQAQEGRGATPVQATWVPACMHTSSVTLARAGPGAGPTTARGVSVAQSLPAP